MSRRWSSLLVIFSLTLACGDSGSGTNSNGETSETSETSSAPSTSETAGETGVAARPNWHEDVAPLVAEHCQGCHKTGGIAPFTLESYAEASPWAPVIADVTEAGDMPPWHALTTDQCTPALPYKHDAQLSPETITTLRDWSDLGAPEGDPTLAAPLPAPPDLNLADITVTDTMDSPVTIAAEGNTLDFFHCLSIDPGNTETVYLTGIQTIPGNPAIVHHVLTYVDETAASADWPGGVQEDCGGGAGVNAPTTLIGAWVPGGLPMEPPADTGITLEPGSRLIMNVHYHATGGEPETDSGTGLGLRWTTQTPAYQSIFRLLGAPGDGDSLTGPLMIPAGASGHVEEYEWVVSANGQPFPDSVDVRMWAIASHMHKVAVDMRVWVEDRDTGDETCLLHVPKWDFNWQRIYEYDVGIQETVRLRAGDKVRIRCEYDNTLDNPSVVEALAEVGEDAPIDVQQGEGTLDEMCIAAVGIGFNGI